MQSLATGPAEGRHDDIDQTRDIKTPAGGGIPYPQKQEPAPRRQRLAYAFQDPSWDGRSM